VSTGYCYSRVLAFTRDDQQGFYLEACCAGLEGVLEDYRETVLGIERLILTETTKFPLTKFQLLLSDVRDSDRGLLTR
jgi:hypothetical protein